MHLSRALPALAGLVLIGGTWLTRPVAAPNGKTPLPKLPLEGGLAFEVRDAATNRPIPAKLTLLGQRGTPDPRFTSGDIGVQQGEAIACYNKIMGATGIGVVRVPYGVYDVYVSRGPEWDLAIIRNVKVDAGGAEVRTSLRHVVDTTGWISADFHVHAHKSPDSKVPMLDRVFEFVSDGVEVIVSTDHNYLADYAPYIVAAGVGKHLTSMVGNEVTTQGWGHFGAFPLVPEAGGVGEGAMPVRGKTPNEMFASIRRHSPGAIINIHHPRLMDVGYFNLGKLDSKSDKATRKGFSYDFDALEVVNGYQDPDRRSVDQSIEDWFSLLNHGHRITATGNSDTHYLNHNIGGYPRNYVQVKDDRPEVVRPDEIAKAVKAHRAFFTTGPFVQLKVNGGSIGDTVPCPGKLAHAEVVVQAAPWITVNRVRLYLNGKPIKEWKVTPSTAPLRFHEKLGFAVPGDSWVVARVDGDKEMSPVVGYGKRFDVYPLAVTNPIFLDADEDGVCKPREKHGQHAP